MSAVQPVVVTQPVMTTTVVTTQPAQLRNWNTGQCDCGDDLKSCCCATFMGNCYYATIASRMGENCCVGCSGYCSGCIPGGHMAMRTRFRTLHGIKGTICDDCVMMSFCLPCSMCQMSREMDMLGYEQNC